MSRLLLAAAVLVASLAVGTTAAAPPAVSADLAEYRAATDRIVARLPALSHDELARSGFSSIPTSPSR